MTFFPNSGYLLQDPRDAELENMRMRKNFRDHLDSMILTFGEWWAKLAVAKVNNIYVIKQLMNCDDEEFFILPAEHFTLHAYRKLHFLQ